MSEDEWVDGTNFSPSPPSVMNMRHGRRKTSDGRALRRRSTQFSSLGEMDDDGMVEPTPPSPQRPHKKKCALCGQQCKAEDDIVTKQGQTAATVKAKVRVEL